MSSRPCNRFVHCMPRVILSNNMYTYKKALSLILGNNLIIITYLKGAFYNKKHLFLYSNFNINFK